MIGDEIINVNGARYVFFKRKIRYLEIFSKTYDFEFRFSLRGITMEEARRILGSCGPEIDIIVARFFIKPSIIIKMATNDPHLIREPGQPETSAPSGGSSSAASQQGQGNSIIISSSSTAASSTALSSTASSSTASP